MREIKHYCDRCNKEVKYFFNEPNFIPITIEQNTYDDIIKGDDISMFLHTKFKRYELCGTCYKDLIKFLKQ